MNFINGVLGWIDTLPIWQAALFLAIGVSLRAQMTYWLGILINRGLLKTKFAKKMNSASVQEGTSAIQKFGWPIIPISFLTVGFQTAVQLGAGILNWPWIKYTLAAIPGYLIWGTIYAAGGLALFRSISRGSYGLFAVFIIVVIIAWIIGYLVMKNVINKNNTN